ncbi:MAG: TonB-dependent hemoglobin/transferrin/lactoferrin family receptor [Giesbergeria sp.]
MTHPHFRPSAAFATATPPAFSLRLPAVLALLACAACGTAWAQGTAVTVAANTLPEVVVSGSRQEQASDDLPVSIDVIGAQDISDRQSTDLRDAVRDLPNISVQTAPGRLTVTGAGASALRDGNMGLNIRGLGGNRVLMLVDGIRVPRSYAFRITTFDREYLSLELLKRVEIVRGPASALYGSDGLAGMANFITYEPQDFLKNADGTSKTFGGRVSAGWSGDDKGHTVSGTVAGRASDSLDWLLTASASGAHALETRGSNFEDNLNRTAANPQKDSGNSLLGKIVLRPTPGQKHTFTLEHVEKSSDVELLSSRTPLPFRGTPAQVAGAIVGESSTRDMERDRITWDARFDLNAPWADHVQTVIAAQRAKSQQVGTSVRNTLPLRIRDTRYGENTWQAGLQADKLVKSGDWSHRLTYGYDYVRSNVENLYTGLNPAPPEKFPLKRFPDTRDTTHGLYLQDESVWGDWSFTPGLRFDHFALDVTSQAGFYPPASQPGKSLSDSALSPKFGLLYRATPVWTVYGQYAAGFRAPDAGQVNGYFENMAERLLVVPNPDLKPERSRGVELGARARYDALRVDVAAFSTNYSNLIVDRVLIGGAGTAADPRIFQTINTERARIHGFEVKGVMDWGRVELLGGARLSTPFSYGQTRGSNTDTGAPLNSVEPAQLALGVQLDTAPWTLRLDMRHHAAKNASDIDDASVVKAPATQLTIPAATTLDLALQWRIRKDVRLNFAVRNLTDRKYWAWSDVQGLAAASNSNDAYTRPGRSGHVSMVVDF